MISHEGFRNVWKRLSYSWSSPEDLQEILTSILLAYNSRPHQGKGLAGLSPNELDRRLGKVKAKAAHRCTASLLTLHHYSSIIKQSATEIESS
jgi:hypothetical protein